MDSRMSLALFVLSTLLAVGLTRNLRSCNVNGNFHPHGSVFTMPGASPCIKFKCNNGGWDFYQEACQMDNKCHSIGSVYEKDCTSYLCKKTDMGGGRYMYKMEVTSMTCQMDNKCHSIGSVYEKDCTSYLCKKTDMGGGRYMYKMEVTSMKCKDADGNCRSPGTQFPAVIRGHYYRQCSCTVGNRSTKIYCFG